MAEEEKEFRVSLKKDNKDFVNKVKGVYYAKKGRQLNNHKTMNRIIDYLRKKLVENNIEEAAEQIAFLE